MIDRDQFYAGVSKYVEVTPDRKQGFEYIMNEWERHVNTDDSAYKELAYVLATSWHETGKTMQPLTEQGPQKYLKGKPYYPYIGRGYVQLTWKENYEKYGIADTPEKALDPVIAAHILVDGMVNGIFTGKKLDDYFGDDKEDPVGARHIINGNDQSTPISQYYEAFFEALTNQTGSI